MEILVAVCLVGAVFCVGLQVVWAYRFASLYLSKPTCSASAQGGLPSVLVVLCVRGADPFLADCLNGLLCQNYPHYEVCIIVDSEYDPAWSILTPILSRRQPDNFKAQVLVNRQETCSLKMSALVQALRQTDAPFQAIALIDADVRPYRNWLRDLVDPLTDPGVGASTGVRWYVPVGKTSLGTRVRSLWNTMAWTQMYAFHIPWAGSMALRSELLGKADLLEKWSQSFAEDTGSYQVLRSHGLELRLVPAATMVNCETTSLADSFRFIRRQLFCARLHHNNWPAVLAAGLGIPVQLAACSAVCLTTLVLGHWLWATLLAAPVILFPLAIGLIMAWVDRRISCLVQARGESPYDFQWDWLLAIPMTAAVHFASLLSASFVRRIEWRGIAYELEDGGRLRLVEYHPFRAPTPVSAGSHPPLATGRGESRERGEANDSLV